MIYNKIDIIMQLNNVSQFTVKINDENFFDSHIAEQIVRNAALNMQKGYYSSSTL